MQQAVTIIALAVIVESLVKYATYKLPKGFVPPWLKVYAGMAIGVVLCILYSADLMPILGLPAVPAVGTVVTGLLIGRGANVIHDIFDRIKIVSTPAAPVKAVLEQSNETKTVSHDLEEVPA